jgi:hypothetical protein
LKGGASLGAATISMLPNEVLQESPPLISSNLGLFLRVETMRGIFFSVHPVDAYFYYQG